MDTKILLLRRRQYFKTWFAALLAYLAYALAFLLFDFVAAEVFLGLGENDVLAKNRIVFPEAELVWGVHRIFLGVILTNTGLLRNQTDELALSIIFLCHNILYFSTRCWDCKQGKFPMLGRKCDRMRIRVGVLCEEVFVW